MSLCNCNCKCRCVIAAIIVSAIIGVITAFLQITGAITVTPVFLWVLFGIAVVGLGVLVVAAALVRRNEQCDCQSAILSTLLSGILGTVLFAVVLLALGITATSIVDAILVGLLLFFFALTITGAACFVRCLLDRVNE